jgi:hypothetical protein
MTYRNQTTSKIVQNGLAAVQRGDLCHYFREMLNGWDGLRWRDGLKQLVKEIGNFDEDMSKITPWASPKHYRQARQF